MASEAIHQDEITLMFGCCCANCGLYRGECVGVSSDTTLCCIEHMCCLRMGADLLCCSCGGHAKKYCQLGIGCCSIACVAPTAAVCQSQGQICCLVQSCSIPPDARMPTSFACLGIACLPRCGCCIRLAHHKPKGGPPAPDMIEQEAPESLEMTTER